jgi:hypothetical protein
MIRGSLIILLLAGGLSTHAQDRGGRSHVPLPDETAGFDHVARALVYAFDQVDIVALGDSHGRKADSDLRIGLVRLPDFPKKVRSIVVEFGSTAQQAVLDRYIQGEDVSPADLQHVWRNTTQTNGVWDSPVYADFFAAVREVNRKLPAGRRIRVFAGDPPTGSTVSRDVSAASIVKTQVLDKGGKALLIYGSAHLYRTGGITKLLESPQPGRLFVVDVLGGAYPEYQMFEGALKSTERPVLVSLRRSPFRDFRVEDFLGRGNKRLVGGLWVNAYLGSRLTLGQMADACVYLGMAPELEKTVAPVP